MSDAPQTTAITKPAANTPAANLNRMLNAKMKDLAQYARNNVSPATMIRLAVYSFANDEKLAKCRPETFYTALITAAQLGLEPSGVRGEAYLVPFKGACTLIPGWRGLIKLALRSKAVKSIYSHVVHAGDDFVVTLGSNVSVHHVPALNAGRNREVIAAYAVAVLENGERDVEVMDGDELAAIREFATKNGISPAWSEWADQMYRKAPIRRLCKRLPLGDDYFIAAKLDELHEQGKPEAIAQFIDVPSVEAPAVEVVEDAPPADRISTAMARSKS